MGATTPFEKDVAGGTGFTIGFDYERRITPTLGVLGLAEFIRGDHKRTELFAVAAAWRPVESLLVSAGPGFELVEKDKS